MRSPKIVIAAGAAVMSMLVVGLAAPAHALDSPEPVGAGALYAEDFADIADWTPVSGTAAPWAASGGIASVDTSTLSSGSYLRPSGSLALPSAYELRTHLRIDSLAPDGTVSLLMDMTDTTSLRASGLSVQLTNFVEGRAGVRVAKPIASSVLCTGKTPVTRGAWVELTVRRANDVTAVYVDDALVAAAASPQSGGTIGLGAYRAKASFGPVSVDPLASPPADHPAAAAGCSWTPGPTPTPTPTPTAEPTAPVTPTEIDGDGEWIAAAPAASDRPGHEVTAGQGTISLDGDWSFATDPTASGEASGWQSPGTDVSEWEVRSVPDNWDLSDRYGTYTGAAWYRRTFQTGDVSPAAHERVILRFGAVYEKTDVWVNGKKAGSHRGGYTPFEFDVTALLVDGENTVAVRADNTFQQGAWWSWGGISRSVALVKTDTVTIDRQQTVATPDLAAGTAEVTSTVFVDNASSSSQAVALRGRITDATTGAVIADGLHASLDVAAGTTGSVDLRASLSSGSFRLWGLDDAALYRFDVTLDLADGHTDSAVSDRFGIRLFEIDGIAVTLNGEQLRLAGANRVSDDPVHGNTEPIDLVRRDMDRMKASGLDLTRIMHFAQDPELLDYADEIGMLLIDEVPVWQNGRSLALADIQPIKDEFRVMVERDFNHPSIFAHSVANEIPADSETGKRYDKAMYDYSKEIDPGRFVTQATNTMNWLTADKKDNDGSQYMDFVSINTYDLPYFAINASKPLDFWNKPVFVSEYSPDGYTFGINRETLDFTTKSAETAHIFADLPHVFGWSQWTYNDYRSRFTGTGTNTVRGWGNQDVWGRLKAGYAATQRANAPVAALSFAALTVEKESGMLTARVEPREATSPGGPLRTLRDHRLVVRAVTADGTVVGGTLVDLPEIAPGSDTLTIPAAWTSSGAASRIDLSLLSPLGYEVLTTVRDVAAPAAPVIEDVVASGSALRVRWQDAAEIGAYRVRAIAPDGKVAAEMRTREAFADLAGLTAGTVYRVSVVAVGVGSDGADLEGAAAESTGTPLASGKVAPKVLALTPAPSALVLGFSSPTRGGTFEVEVTDAASGAAVQSYTTTNRPGTRVEGLTAGVEYSVRIRQTKDPANTSAGPSVWSERLTATPLAEAEAPSLDTRGVIAGAREAAVIVSPTAETVRYRVSVSGPGVDRTFDVERAAVDVLPLDGLEPGSAYQVAVSAVGAAGVSAQWTGAVTTRAETVAPVTPTGATVGNRGNDVVLSWDPQQVDGYVLTRLTCGPTQMTTQSPEAVLGLIGQFPGKYTVAAAGRGAVSSPSAEITVPGRSVCGSVVSPSDTTARDDGSVPFALSSGWSSSSLAGPDGTPSVYADLSSAPRAAATWTSELPETSGRLRIEASLPPSGTSTTKAVYTITDARGTHTVTVDQSAKGGTWVDLGVVEVSEQKRATVVLTATGSGILRAASLRFTVVPTPDRYPSAPQPGFADQTVGSGETVKGTGTPGNEVALHSASGPVGTTVVDADGTWGVVPTLPPGQSEVTATETTEDGWTGSASAIVTLRVDDGATASPAPAVLSSDNGWDTGLHDGDFHIMMNLWWGENASSFRLYENGRLIATEILTAQSPRSQAVQIPITGRPNGTFVYTGVLANSRGESPTDTVTVEVRDAAPGVPQLSDDNADGDGTFTLLADMWWGTNATSYRFLEGTAVIAEGSLTAATPGAQRARAEVRNAAPGDHVFTVEFVNAAGATVSAPTTVTVRSNTTPPSADSRIRGV